MVALYIRYITVKKTKTLQDVPKLWYDGVLAELTRMYEDGEITKEEWEQYTGLTWED